MTTRPAPGRLHVITDEELQARHSHFDLARLAVAGGADAVQLREKRRRSTAELVCAARAIAAVVREAGAVLIVNDRADVAAAVDGAGVHLGADDLDVRTARRLLGPQRLIGRSVRAGQELSGPEDLLADYFGVGPVFATASKAGAGPVIGLEGLRAVAARAKRPLIAIGGITPERVPEVLRAGAHGVAVLSAVCLAPDPEQAVREIAAIVASFPPPEGP